MSLHQAGAALDGVLPRLKKRLQRLESPLRIELVKHGGIAFRVQAVDHPALGTVDDVAAKNNAPGFKVSDETIKVIDLERDSAASVGTGRVGNEIGEGKATAARQVVFDPVSIVLIAHQARYEAKAPS